MNGALAAALLVGGGLAMVVVGLLRRGRDRQRALAEILDLPYGEHDVPIEAVTEQPSLVVNAVGAASQLVARVDPKGALEALLERARIPLRPAEYVLLTGLAALGAAGLGALVFGQWLLAVGAGGTVVALARILPRHRVDKRRRAFEEQLPDALSLIASSLAAGHTFLRAISMMVEEAEPPLCEEFERVVQETRLGDSVVDALERMARRIDVPDLVWVVQAIRIQQTVGGKLADLLHTLADFIRSREEVRREVQVLTAEGRMSAWVLGALPVLLVAAIQVIDPDYLQPMFRGWGPIVLACTAGSVLMGVTVIRRMVRIEV